MPSFEEERHHRCSRVLASLVAKVASIVPIEPGERVLGAAYVPAIGATRRSAGHPVPYLAIAFAVAGGAIGRAFGGGDLMISALAAGAGAVLGAAGDQALHTRRSAEPTTAGPSMGPSVVAVSDRRFLYAPRSAFMSSSSWRDRRLDDVRVEASTRRSMGFVVARRFEVFDTEGIPLIFELEQKKDAQVFRTALARRLVPPRTGS